MSDSSQSQPPGWYYAQGDPPDTQRYWDGTAWQGGPQPVPGAGQAAAAPGGMAGGVPGAAMAGAVAVGTPAEVGTRFVAFLIDWGIAIGIGIVFGIFSAIAGAGSDALGTIVSLLGNLASLAYWIYNGLYLQGTTGQTIGKKQQNIMLLSSNTGQVVGIGQAFLRSLLQGLTMIVCFIPWLVDNIFILSKPDHKRFTDDILKMHVYRA